MSSPSETTKPLSQDEIRSYSDVPPQMDSPWAQHLVDRLIATIRSLQAENEQTEATLLAYKKELTIANGLLAARDERIRAFRTILHGIDNCSVAREQGAFIAIPRSLLEEARALLKEADDG